MGSLLGGYCNADDQANTIFFWRQNMTVQTFESQVATKIDATFAETAKLPLTGPDNHASPHYGIVRTDLTGPEAWFPVTVKKIVLA